MQIPQLFGMIPFTYLLHPEQSHKKREIVKLTISLL